MRERTSHLSSRPARFAYECETRGIRVSVTPAFVEDQSDPEEGDYLWSYAVTIENHGTETVQLLSRYWHITDGIGRIQEVHGPGVVGAQPMLEPGQIFEYTSGCPLPTPSGAMSRLLPDARQLGGGLRGRNSRLPARKPLRKQADSLRAGRRCATQPCVAHAVPMVDPAPPPGRTMRICRISSGETVHVPSSQARHQAGIRSGPLSAPAATRPKGRSARCCSGPATIPIAKVWPIRRPALRAPSRTGSPATTTIRRNISSAPSRKSKAMTR